MRRGQGTGSGPVTWRTVSNVLKHPRNPRALKLDMILDIKIRYW